MLSGRGLCDELITRPEESYRLFCVVVCDLESSRIGAPYIYIYIYDISSLRVNHWVVMFCVIMSYKFLITLPRVILKWDHGMEEAPSCL